MLTYQAELDLAKEVKTNSIKFFSYLERKKKRKKERRRRIRATCGQ